MSKIDKYMEGRLDGMARGLLVAETKGIDALREEVKLRKAIPVQLEIDEKAVKETYSDIVSKIYSTLTAIVLKSIHDVFGAGEKRLKIFLETFNKEVEWLHKADEFGMRYSTFTEIADDLNRKYHLDIQMGTVKELDKVVEKDMDLKCSITAMYDFLKLEGFTDAAARVRQFFEEAFINYQEMTFEDIEHVNSEFKNMYKETGT